MRRDCLEKGSSRRPVRAENGDSSSLSCPPSRRRPYLSAPPRPRRRPALRTRRSPSIARRLVWPLCHFLRILHPEQFVSTDNGDYRPHPLPRWRAGTLALARCAGRTRPLTRDPRRTWLVSESGDAPHRGTRLEGPCFHHWDWRVSYLHHPLPVLLSGVLFPSLWEIIGLCFDFSGSGTG